MVFFNWATMQMAAKIVYYGPGLCGKTTNLSYIYAKTSPNCRGEMVSLETESDRTLFFDLLPIEVGTIGGFKTRMQLYTVPGQVFYNTTRKLVLKGVDGVVFVADSQRPMREANIESFKNLNANLAELDISLDDMPLVIQYNKRDLKQILTLEELDADFNPDGDMITYEASAINGTGVFETLKEITKLTLKKLRHRMAAPDATGSSAPRPSTPPTTLSVSQPQSPEAGSAAAAGTTQQQVQPVRSDSESSRQPASISAAALAAAAEEAVDDSGLVATDAAADEGPSTPHAEPTEPTPLAATTVEPDAGVSPAGEPVAEPAPFETEFEQPHAPIETPDEHEDAPVSSASTPSTAEEPPKSPPEQVNVGPDKRPEETDETEPFAEPESHDETPPVSPPKMKRVHVSDQVDILGELDNLRKQATMGSYDTAQQRMSTSSKPKDTSLDLDSLLGGPKTTRKELRHKIAKGLNSGVFEKMHRLQIAMRIQDASGETIHTLEPVQMTVGEATHLHQLMLYLTVDLENKS